MPVFKEVFHKPQCCVIGAGMAGIAAAVAAARRGARVVLMQDRPVLGGNASSECRVHVGGADVHNKRKNMRETGILEEIRLDNLRANPNRCYSVWDLVLYETVMREPHITLLLNCSCFDADRDGARIASVTGWQSTTQTRRRVEADIFIDCSGDSVLAPLTGADVRMGREARHEHGESIAPEQADACTMGMTCLFQARRHDTPQPFTPPPWAEVFDSCDALPYGAGGHRWWQMGYWWIELGGEDHSIEDTESLRDRLLALTLGVWDHVKNRCGHSEEAENWALEWLQFLPGKRESRRYLGPHILTQNDVESEGRFEDRIAYGGWSMDDHHPSGFRAVQIGAPATIFHRAPSPYGIPYRCLHSRNVPNLMFAGRNISATHAALSSTRVMGTCCALGQAAGTAAALAVRRGIEPAEVGTHIAELQQQLLEDDAYIPWLTQEMPARTRQARLEASQGDPEPVRDGIQRPVGDEAHAWECAEGDWIALHFGEPVAGLEVGLILDSGLDQNIAMSYHEGLKSGQLSAPPDVMPRAFRLEGRTGDDWQTLAHVEDNHRRQVRFAVEQAVDSVRFVLEKTWGGAPSRVYAFVARGA